MARISIDGVELEYELLGERGRPAIAITPGGRFARDAAGVPELGYSLANSGYRVLLWDRPNCGASDLCFRGNGESSMQAEFLVKLIRTLELGPTALVGGSAGSRISLFAARIDPTAISRMALWWISGGVIGFMRLGSYYCCEPAEEASLRGMEAVARMPIWSQQLARNPRNRDILLGMDRDAFIAVMTRWAQGYIPVADSPIPGIGKHDFARMTMPVMVLRGSPRDIYHPASVCEQVQSLLPNSRLADAPWPIDVFATRMVDGKGLFSDWPLLAPQLVSFMQE
jgi:pimeloyl-ACP methyl ester carboxylesterase